MYVDRFVRAELVVEREQPQTHEIEDLLIDAGLAGSTQETLVVVSYDSINQIRTIQEVVRGGYHELKIPTMADVDAVHMIMAAANTVGLYFDDSLIIGPGTELYSMREHGLIVLSPKAIEMANGRNHQRAPGS